MKRIRLIVSFTAFSVIISLPLTLPGCKKTDNPIKYLKGTVPDSVFNLEGLNSQYDDYNTNLYIIGSRLPVIFSSNRGSSGGQFDLVQGILEIQFDQTNGNFEATGEMANDIFYAGIISRLNTAGNEFGPYSVFGSADGYEYMTVTSQGQGGQLDLYYLKYLPRFGLYPPTIISQDTISLLNSPGNDGYITFDMNTDTVYFSSDRGGNFDIYVHKRNSSLAIETFFTQAFEASPAVDSVITTSDEQCPFVYKNIMVFASNRPGGIGGYDLYYSVFKKGKWSSPVNMGPDINTTSDEFRPILGQHPDFTNYLLVFSSNRPGGKGNFDLYLTGLDHPE